MGLPRAGLYSLLWAGIVGAMTLPAYAWEVSSTDCGNTNEGSYGLSYVVGQINKGLGTAEIQFDFGSGTHYVDCDVTVSNRFVSMQTIAGDVILRGTMDFQAGADLTDCTFAPATVYCRSSAGTIDQCVFNNGQLHLGDNYSVQDCLFSNVTVTADDRNHILASVQWYGDNSPINIGAANEIRAGNGLRMNVSGDSNVVSGVGLRALTMYGSHNTFTYNTNCFDVSFFQCLFQGTNNIIEHNEFCSGQQGSVTIIGDDNLIRNNTSYSNQTGFVLEGHRNTLRGNLIGTLPDGLTAAPNTVHGILLEGDNNVIGGTNTADRNVIACAARDGIQVRPVFAEDSTTNGLIQGNYIGLNANGEPVGGIGENGIYIWGGSGHRVGGPGGARNVIAACERHGIRIQRPGLIIEHNLVGLSPTGGLVSIGMDGSYDGIRVQSEHTVIRDNYICGATNGWGIYFSFGHNAQVTGNRIGTGLTGTEAFGNGRGGIYAINTTNLTIGGTAASNRNIIVASRGATTNEGAGILFDANGQAAHRVTGNYIGLGADGSTLLSNANYGILIKNTDTVTIGGTNSAAANVIAGSGIAGIGIYGGNSHIICANRIGTDATGENARGNYHGVYLQDAVNNRIGGSPVPLGNLVSGNRGDGVRLAREAYTNYIQGNLIGTAANGIEALGNEGYGVFLDGRTLDYVNYNWIGGTNNSSTYWREGNVISGNGAGGILINTNARYNCVDGNLIGLDTNGTVRIENFGHGIHVYGRYSEIGLADGNIICGNAGDGIRFENSYGSSCNARYNHIGLTEGGQTNIGNSGHGIAMIGRARYNHIGQTLTNGYNSIGGNLGAGIYISTNCYNNFIRGNYIGYPPPYEDSVPNAEAAIHIDSVRDTWVGGVSGNQGNVLDGAIGLFMRHTTNSWVYDNSIGFDTNQIPISTNLEYGIVIDGGDGDGFGQSSRRNRIGAAREAAIHMLNSVDVRFNYLEVGYEKNAIGQAVTNAGTGLLLSNSTECVIRYSNIGRSRNGVILRNTLSNQVQFCNIGAAANNPVQPAGNAGAGVMVINGAFDMIGGEYWPQNIISGNGGHGVEIRDSVGVLVGGNHIGLDEAGDVAVHNQGHGVYIENSLFCFVGGDITYRNYIAGNIGDGVYVTDEGASAGHVIAGNRIGMSVPGWHSATNGGHGVALHNVADITVGGTNTDYSNFLGGNLGHGVVVSGALSGAHAILFNGVGADSDWNHAVPNAQNGITILNGTGHMIAGNMIAGNTGHGVLLAGGNVQQVLLDSNLVGMQTNGLTAVPNGADGIRIEDAPANTLTNNLISGNTSNGVTVLNTTPPYSSAVNNRISANIIGADITGENGIGNGDNGILLDHVTFTYIGLNNIIACSGNDGIELWNAASHDNFIHGNMIGGATNLGNIGHGIQLHGGDANRVGSTNLWEANDISYNLGHGIAVFTGNRNKMLGNAIYSNLLQGIRLGTQAYSYAECNGCPNRYQRQPAITNVFRGSTHIYGILESASNSQYLVEFFATEALNFSGFGEGKMPLWRDTYTTDESGRVPFSVYYPYTTPTGWIITATATDTNGNTSTFSPAAVVAEAPDTYGYGVPDFWQDEYTNLQYGTAGQAFTNDYDGDGMTDREEYISGTDPEDAASFLQMTLGSLEVPQSSKGRDYTLERNTDLISGTWDFWREAVGTGSNILFELDSTGAETVGVFRVRASIP
jgi:hypothetical protein